MNQIVIIDIWHDFLLRNHFDYFLETWTTLDEIVYVEKKLAHYCNSLVFYRQRIGNDPHLNSAFEAET